MITVSLLAGNNGLTQVYNSNADPFLLSLIDGTITVTTSAVPEPSSLLMGVIAASGLFFMQRRRRSR